MKTITKKTIALFSLLLVLIFSFPFLVARGEATFEMFFFAEDSAHTSGDKGYLTLGVRQDVSTSTTGTADGDYGYIAINKYGAQRVESMVSSTTISIDSGNFDKVYGDTADLYEFGTSLDFDTTQFSKCAYMVAVDSTGVGAQEMRYILQYKSGGFYFNYGFGPWMDASLEDTANVSTSTYSFPFPGGSTYHIIATTTSTSASLQFTQASSTVLCTNG